MHRIASDIVFRMLRGGHLTEDTHRAFARGVCRFLCRRLTNPGDRRNINDRSSTGGSHRRDRRLRTKKHSLRIDRHNAVPFLFCTLFDWHPRHEDGRVVYQYIELAEGIDSETDRGLPIIGTRHIQMPVVCVAAIGPDLSFYSLPFLICDVAKDNLRPLFRKQPRFCGTLVLCAATD